MILKYSGFKIGRIPITAKLLLYTMFAAHAVNVLIANVYMAATATVEFSHVFFIGILSILATIGFILIILSDASIWRLIGGITLFFTSIIGLGSLPFLIWAEDYGFFYPYPHLLAPFMAALLAWFISGILIMINEDLLVKPKVY